MTQENIQNKKKRSWFGNLVSGLTSKAPEASVEIDRPQGFYRSGETIKARVTVSSADQISVNGIFAGLFSSEQCREIEHDTEDGESTTWRDYPQWLDRRTLVEAGELPAGFQKNFDLEFVVPANARGNYYGDIIKLNNRIMVEIDRPAAKDVFAEAPVRISEFIEREEPVADYLRITPPDSQMQMMLWIPRLAFREGETVSGKIIIDPHADAKVRSIALNYKRLETTTGGSRTNKNEWTEQTVQLAGESLLQKGKRLSFDFQIALPNKNLPSFQSSVSSSRAYLEVNLDVPWGRDFTASQEIKVFGGES